MKVMTCRRHTSSTLGELGVVRLGMTYADPGDRHPLLLLIDTVGIGRTIVSATVATRLGDGVPVWTHSVQDHSFPLCR
jgi:hypothetical protein